MSVNPRTDPQGAAEFQAGKAAARASRQAFRQSPDSKFVRTMQAAISQYLTARTQGVSREDGIRGLEEELRGAWPKSVSKFKPGCDACEDTGWAEHTCWDQHRCGRRVCANNPDRQHLYVEPCHCPKGDAKRARVPVMEDAMAAAGRTQRKRKPGGWRQAGG